MASMKDIKRRKESIQSTGQITKAMKLVATVKLQKARGRAESAKPYFDAMYETVSTMLARTGDINHRYLKAGDTNKKAIIVITAKASGETVKVTVVFQAVLCGGEDGFRSEGTQREGSDAEAAALQKIPAGKDVVHKKLLMMPCGPGRIV